MVNVMYEQGANFWDLRHWEYIGWRESHCILDALADDRDDYSVCWFQINYKGSLRAGRTAAYGPPDLLREDAVACADAALGLYNANGFAPWGG